MLRHPTSPLANVVIVAIGTSIFLFEWRLGRRAARLNREGRCARCGEVMVTPAARIWISGGPTGIWMGWVCARCLAKSKIQEKIMWAVGTVVVIGLIVLLWRT